MPPPLRRIPEPTSPSPMSECPRVATNAATPSRLSGESRNPRHLSGARMPASCHECRHPLPSFRRMPEPTSPLRCPNARELPRMPPPPPVFPANAGTHVAFTDVRMPASCHGCRHPLQSFRRMPELTSPSPMSECPRVATDAATPSSLSGKSRNPRRLPRCPNARELPRMPPPPPVFPAKAGTHVASPVSAYPRVATDAATPSSLSGKSRNPRRLSGARMPASWRKGTLDVGVTSNLSK